MNRAVASLTVLGGQEFHFPHFFLKFQSIFPQTLLIFFLILALRVGESPTREGPGYATVHEADCKNVFPENLTCQTTLMTKEDRHATHEVTVKIDTRYTELA